MAWIFAPTRLGSNWQATVASITGLVAKGRTSSVPSASLYGSKTARLPGNGRGLHRRDGLQLLVFNLLCAPCFAAIGATSKARDEQPQAGPGSRSAIGAALHTVIALMINQFGSAFSLPLPLIVSSSPPAIVYISSSPTKGGCETTPAPRKQPYGCKIISSITWKY